MKKNKSILMVSEYFYPHWTGIAKAFFCLAENVKNQGYKVTVLTTKYDKNLEDSSLINNVKIIRIPYLYKISRTHYSFSILIEYIKKVNSYDGVIINSPNSNILVFSIFAKIFQKKLYIFHQGDIILPKLTGNRIVNVFIEKLFDILTIPSMFLADVVSTYTLDYAQKSRVMKYFTYKFQPFIPNFKLAQDFKPSKKIVNKLSLLKKSGFLVGFAGRFVEEKGFDILLSTINDVKKQVGTTYFIFAGKTDVDYEPFFNKLKVLINNHKASIIFLGLLNENDLAYFYKQLDVFVISSRSDCFPLTQIEAVKSRIPIVVTDIPGARMIVKTSGYGEIAKAENPNDLARKLVKVLTNEPYYQKKFKAAIDYLTQYDQFPINI